MVSREFVQWGYRLILGREPESEEIIQQKMQCRDAAHLSECLIYSDEFVMKQPSFIPPLNKWVLSDNENGFKIWVNLADTYVSWQILRKNFENSELSFLKRHVKEGDIAIDLGANIGYFSLVLANLVGPSGKVISFEPLPFLHEKAAMSVRENGFDHCTVHNVAIAHEPGTAAMIYNPSSPNWGGAYLSFDGSVPPDHDSLPVPVRPLADYVAGLSPKLIKIDVEGGEYLVISSAIDFIAETKPIIMSEIHTTQLHRVSNVSPAEYIHLLQAIGYRCFELQHGGELGREMLGNETFDVTNVAFMPHA